MFGRDDAPGDATMTSQRGCVGSTGRRLPQGMESGLRGSSTSSREEDRRTKSLEAENKELRARIEALEKMEWEGVQGGHGLTSRRESGLDEEWRMEMDLEDEVESRKKLDEQRRKLQKELRDIEKFSCVPKEFQENLESNL